MNRVLTLRLNSTTHDTHIEHKIAIGNHPEWEGDRLVFALCEMSRQLDLSEKRLQEKPQCGLRPPTT